MSGYKNTHYILTGWSLRSLKKFSNTTSTFKTFIHHASEVVDVVKNGYGSARNMLYGLILEFR